MPLADPAERVKQGPPSLNSLATRDATIPPRAPRVLLKVKGGEISSFDFSSDFSLG